MAKLIQKEEMEKQKEYTEKIAELNAHSDKFAFVDTYGCHKNE